MTLHHPPHCHNQWCHHHHDSSCDVAAAVAVVNVDVNVLMMVDAVVLDEVMGPIGVCCPLARRLALVRARNDTTTPIIRKTTKRGIRGNVFIYYSKRGRG